jgi:hypothetical protein
MLQVSKARAFTAEVQRKAEDKGARLQGEAAATRTKPKATVSAMDPAGKNVGGQGRMFRRGWSPNVRYIDLAWKPVVGRYRFTTSTGTFSWFIASSAPCRLASVRSKMKVWPNSATRNE